MANNSRQNFKVVLLGEGCVGKTSIVLRYIEDKFNSNHISTVQASFLNKRLNINGRRVNLAIWDTAGQEKFHALGPIYYRSSNGAVLVYDITDEDSFQKVKSWVKELRKMLGSDICLVIVGNKTDLEKDRNVSLEEAEVYKEHIGCVRNLTGKSSFANHVVSEVHTPHPHNPFILHTLPKGLRLTIAENLEIFLNHRKNPNLNLNDTSELMLHRVFRYATKVGAIHFQTSAKENVGVEETFLTLTKKMLEKAADTEEEKEVFSRGNSQRKNVVVVEDDQVPEAPSKQCCTSS